MDYEVNYKLGNSKNKKVNYKMNKSKTYEVNNSEE